LAQDISTTKSADDGGGRGYPRNSGNDLVAGLNGGLLPGIHFHGTKCLASNEREVRVSAMPRSAFKRPAAFRRPAALIRLEFPELPATLEAGIVILPLEPGEAPSSRASN
jgi:hypothetical protein